MDFFEQPINFIVFFGPGLGGGGGVYVPKLDFSDARNSMYSMGGF